jgi:hypothetical protein
MERGFQQFSALRREDINLKLWQSVVDARLHRLFHADSDSEFWSGIKPRAYRTLTPVIVLQQWSKGEPRFLFAVAGPQQQGRAFPLMIAVTKMAAGRIAST